MLNKLLKPLSKASAFFQRYVVVICFVVFGAMYGYIIFASGQQASKQPSDAEVNNRFQATKRPKLDDAAAETLRKLSDQNVEVKALFDEARSNPFSE